jgi:hypothetical protein
MGKTWLPWAVFIPPAVSEIREQPRLFGCERAATLAGADARRTPPHDLINKISSAVMLPRWPPFALLVVEVITP